MHFTAKLLRVFERQIIESQADGFTASWLSGMEEEEEGRLDCISRGAAVGDGGEAVGKERSASAPPPPPPPLKQEAA